MDGCNPSVAGGSNKESFQAVSSPKRPVCSGTAVNPVSEYGTPPGQSICTCRAPVGRAWGTHLRATATKVLELRSGWGQVRVCLWSYLFVEQLHFVQL